MSGRSLHGAAGARHGRGVVAVAVPTLPPNIVAAPKKTRIEEEDDDDDDDDDDDRRP